MEEIKVITDLKAILKEYEWAVNFCEIDKKHYITILILTGSEVEQKEINAFIKKYSRYNIHCSYVNEYCFEDSFIRQYFNKGSVATTPIDFKIFTVLEQYEITNSSEYIEYSTPMDLEDRDTVNELIAIEQVLGG